MEKRVLEFNRLHAKYPEKIPIIIEKKGENIPEIDRKKFLVPNDISMGQFVNILRKRIKLEADQAIFVFTNNRLPPATELLKNIYEQNKDEDGMLYFTYTGETCYG